MRMSDGRNFTDYNTRCGQLQQLRQQADIKSNYDLRMFMMNNAEKLMDQSRMASMQVNDCSPCYVNGGNGTMLPEQSLVECNDRVCHVLPNPRDTAKDGLGQGRKYNSGDASSAAANMTFYPIGGLAAGSHDAFGSPL